jgi:sugar lactone lactonase YvrE
MILTGACAPVKGEMKVEELIKGAPFHGTNGLKVGPNGNLYVGSVLGGEILILDPNTGSVIDRYGADDGVVGPDDVVFGPDGSLYWTDILSGEVGRRTPDGTVTKQLVAPFVNPIAINAEGRLFVAQAFMGDGLFELDPELIDPPRQILGTGDPTYHLNGFDFGPDGYLYAPRQQLEDLVRIDVETGEVEVVTDEISGGTAFDSNGDLYVAWDDAVFRLDPVTGDYELVSEVPNGIDNLAFDAQDNIYLTNFRNGSIHRLGTDGTLEEISPGGMMAPGGITVLPNATGGETLYVADFWTVRTFDAEDGSAGPVGMDFFFDSPFTASTDGENLILTSWFGNTVELWDPVSQSIVGFDQFNVPINAIPFMGEIVVAELGTGSVVSATLGGDRRTLADELIVPTGLAASEDDLWVGDWASGVVYQIVKDGNPLDTPEVIVEGLTTPEGMTLDEDGTLLVVESMLGQLTRVDLDTGETSVVVDGLAIGLPAVPEWPPTWFFNGVTVGEDGAIYITGDAGTVVYRISWE